MFKKTQYIFLEMELVSQRESVCVYVCVCVYYMCIYIKYTYMCIKYMYINIHIHIFNGYYKSILHRSYTI